MDNTADKFVFTYEGFKAFIESSFDGKPSTVGDDDLTVILNGTSRYLDGVESVGVFAAVSRGGSTPDLYVNILLSNNDPSTLVVSHGNHSHTVSTTDASYKDYSDVIVECLVLAVQHNI